MSAATPAPDPAPSSRPPAPVLALVVGTRPEAIKVAPVALAARESRVRPLLVATGQHADPVRDALAEFGLAADVDLAVPRSATGTQAELFAALLPGLQAVLIEHRAAATLVQGDTASALAGALAATWQRSPVVHLEAGLRSFDRDNPFPEEAYRCAIGSLTRLHLAPTDVAVANLRAEGVARDRILRIGNTIVDAGRLAVANRTEPPASGRRQVLVTAHRRENWGEPLRSVLEALRQIVAAVDDVEVLIPVHPNPAVADVVRSALADLDRVRIVEPLSHPQFLEALAASTLVLTDSGGVQEEAPTFGVPTLVLRETTERPEAIEAGTAQLVGTDTARVAGRAIELLTHEDRRRAMTVAESPFGDGASAARAVAAVAWVLGLGERPAEWRPSLHRVA